MRLHLSQEKLCENEASESRMWMNEVLRITENFVCRPCSASNFHYKARIYTLCILTVDEVRGQNERNRRGFFSQPENQETQHRLLTWTRKTSDMYAAARLEHAESDFYENWTHQCEIPFSCTETNYRRYINGTLLSCLVFGSEREIISWNVSQAAALFSGTSHTAYQQKRCEKPGRTDNKNRFVSRPSVDISCFHGGLLFTNLLN